MTPNELIEKYRHEYAEELYTSGFILRGFAVELLELVKAEGIALGDSPTAFNKHIVRPDYGTAINNALEELRFQDPHGCA